MDDLNMHDYGLDEGPDDAEIGRQWRENSSLAKWFPLTAERVTAQAAEIERLRTASPCGHPASLMLKSAETGADLYCELCDEKSGRRDAESRETEMRAEIERLRNLVQTAIHRLEDVMKDDDGQSWKEARKFIDAAKESKHAE